MRLIGYPFAGAGFKAYGPSADCAKAISSTTHHLQRHVVSILSFGRELTADEAAQALGEGFWRIRPRFSELHTMRMIVDTGIRRPSQHGNPSTVWRLA